MDAPAAGGPHTTLYNRCRRWWDKGVFDLIFVQPQQGGVPRLMGGTKGGMSSTLHGVCHSKGGPLRLHLREGQCSDFTGADVLRKDLPSAATVMGDQG